VWFSLIKRGKFGFVEENSRWQRNMNKEMRRWRNRTLLEGVENE